MDGPSMPRRHALCCGAAALSGMFSSLLHAAESAATARPLPPSVRDLVDATFDGLDATRLWDVHAHLLGTGDAGSGCSVHPHLDSWWHPLEALRKRVILHGAGVSQRSRQVDLDYVARLALLAADFPAGAQWMLFAFDHAHDDQGRAALGRTTFHVPDAWAAHVAQRHDDRFVWVASIHPYRDDALPRLRQALGAGALAVKWLPSAMNIDLRDPRCVPFYELLAARRVPLIVHAGEEKAVPGAQRDELGNPLLVRAALRHGVRVIVAHCASLGQALDLDQRMPRERPAFDLFARLMDEREWQGHLLGDVSALFLANRDPRVGAPCSRATTGTRACCTDRTTRCRAWPRWCGSRRWCAPACSMKPTSPHWRRCATTTRCCSTSRSSAAPAGAARACRARSSTPVIRSSAPATARPVPRRDTEG